MSAGRCRDRSRSRRSRSRSGTPDRAFFVAAADGEAALSSAAASRARASFASSRESKLRLLVGDVKRPSLNRLVRRAPSTSAVICLPWRQLGHSSGDHVAAWRIERPEWRARRRADDVGGRDDDVDALHRHRESVGHHLAKLVSWPWPLGWVPITTSTTPLGFIVISVRFLGAPTRIRHSTIIQGRAVCRASSLAFALLSPRRQRSSCEVHLASWCRCRERPTACRVWHRLRLHQICGAAGLRSMPELVGGLVISASIAKVPPDAPSCR